MLLGHMAAAAKLINMGRATMSPACSRGQTAIGHPLCSGLPSHTVPGLHPAGLKTDPASVIQMVWVVGESCRRAGTDLEVGWELFFMHGVTRSVMSPLFFFF